MSRFQEKIGTSLLNPLLLSSPRFETKICCIKFIRSLGERRAISIAAVEVIIQARSGDREIFVLLYDEGLVTRDET